MPSFNDVASQRGLPGGARKQPCLLSDWETSLSSGKKVPIDPHEPKVLAEMIERVHTLLDHEQNCSHEKQKTVNKG